MFRRISLLLFLLLFSHLLVAVFLSVFAFPSIIRINTSVSVLHFFLRFTGISASILVGVALVTGTLRQFLISVYKNAEFWQLHIQWASSLSLGFILTHLVIFYWYRWRLGLPFMSQFFPRFGEIISDSNLIFMASLAFIVLAVNTLISHFHYPDITRRPWWRPLHLFNYIAFILILVHALFLGSDSTNLWLRIIYMLLVGLTLVGIIWRLVSKNSTPPLPT